MLCSIYIYILLNKFVSTDKCKSGRIPLTKLSNDSTTVMRLPIVSQQFRIQQFSYITTNKCVFIYSQMNQSATKRFCDSLFKDARALLLYVTRGFGLAQIVLLKTLLLSLCTVSIQKCFKNPFRRYFTIFISFI